MGRGNPVFVENLFEGGVGKPTIRKNRCGKLKPFTGGGSDANTDRREAISGRTAAGRRHEEGKHSEKKVKLQPNEDYAARESL